MHHIVKHCSDVAVRTVPLGAWRGGAHMHAWQHAHARMAACTCVRGSMRTHAWQHAHACMAAVRTHGSMHMHVWQHAHACMAAVHTRMCHHHAVSTLAGMFACQHAPSLECPKAGLTAEEREHGDDAWAEGVTLNALSQNWRSSGSMGRRGAEGPSILDKRRSRRQIDLGRGSDLAPMSARLNLVSIFTRLMMSFSIS